MQILQELMIILKLLILPYLRDLRRLPTPSLPHYYAASISLYLSNECILCRVYGEPFPLSLQAGRHFE